MKVEFIAEHIQDAGNFNKTEPTVMLAGPWGYFSTAEIAA